MCDFYVKFWASVIPANLMINCGHYYKHGNKTIKPYLDWLKKDVPDILPRIKHVPQLLSVEGEMWRRFYETFASILLEDFCNEPQSEAPAGQSIERVDQFWQYDLVYKNRFANLSYPFGSIDQLPARAE